MTFAQTVFTIKAYFQTKLETLDAPVQILDLIEHYFDNLLFPEEFAIFQNMDPKEPLEQQPSTSNE